MPACDAEILNVYCEFEAAGLLFSLHFELDTGRGGNRFSSSRSLSPSHEPAGFIPLGGSRDGQDITWLTLDERGLTKKIGSAPDIAGAA